MSRLGWPMNLEALTDELGNRIQPLVKICCPPAFYFHLISRRRLTTAAVYQPTAIILVTHSHNIYE